MNNMYQLSNFNDQLETKTKEEALADLKAFVNRIRNNPRPTTLMAEAATILDKINL